MRKQWLITSRIKNDKTREDLGLTGDGWSPACIFYDERRAWDEYTWLSSHSAIREYLMLCKTPTEKGS